MELFQVKDEVKNSTVLLVILGILLVEVVNSVDNLVVGLSKLLFSLLPLKLLTIISISLHGLIFIVVVFILFRILSSKKSHRKNPIIISLKTFWIIGLVSILIVSISIILNLYIELNLGQTIELSRVQDTNINDFAYLIMAQGGLRILTNVTLIIIFFVILLQKRFLS